MNELQEVSGRATSLLDHRAARVVGQKIVDIAGNVIGPYYPSDAFTLGPGGALMPSQAMLAGVDEANIGQLLFGAIVGELLMDGIESSVQNLINTGVLYHDTGLNVIWAFQNYFQPSGPHPGTIDQERWSASIPRD